MRTLHTYDAVLTRCAEMRTLQTYDAVFDPMRTHAHHTDVGSPFMATWLITAPS